MNPEIGIIQREQIPGGRAPGTVAATEAFAAGVAERYKPRATTISCADLALAWEPPAEVNYFYESPRIEISPTVRIEEHYLFTGVSRDLHRGAEAVAGSGEAKAAGALFERLFSRRIRVAAFEPPPQTGGPRDTRRRAIETPPPRPDAVERTINRAVAAAKPSVAAEPAATSGRENGWGTPMPAFTTPAREIGWGAPFASLETPKPVVLPAPEIKRVAEQVMREIDRRVIASRERTGKR